MRIEKENNRIFQLTLSGYELAALISSARYVAEGAKGDMSEEAIHFLKQVIENYDSAARRLNADSKPEENRSEK